MNAVTEQPAVPVIIVGAGPVGLTTALALARHGVRSTVLESKGTLDPHSRATLMVPRSLEIFEQLGVLPALLAQGQRNDAIRIVRAANRKLLLRFDFAPLAAHTRTPYALALSQDRTERVLLDAVLQTGLVDLAWSDGFARFEPGTDSVSVVTAAGRSITARWLVGADGAHSAVRKQLGWRLQGTTYPTRAVLADVRVAPEHDTMEGWLADPQAASFTIAVRFGNGVWRLIESAVPDSVSDADLPARAQQLSGALFGPGAWRETLWTAAYKKHERRAERYVGGRVVLAGDAAHLNSPAGGQGMNAGIQDAELLAQALAQALAAPQESHALLQAYEQARMKAFDRDIRPLTHAIEAMETAPSWLRKLAFSSIGLVRAFGVEAVVAKRLSMLS
jgi:3-(3-hydroxy-phenyl)propionate hydroxylase